MNIKRYFSIFYYVVEYCIAYQLIEYTEWSANNL